MLRSLWEKCYMQSFRKAFNILMIRKLLNLSNEKSFDFKFEFLSILKINRKYVRLFRIYPSPYPFKHGD
ncbi:hypothetical protein BpHYR1_011065 [Brachionus plicatilis]|uniref:Uncharacterized protein n=1 Tax=Brachionus plicatilis TaxID=10195 RepID=A0A3M7PMU7_BRAPC|nr:hypothetical protein BpHYR1_011065 [Brachionus plicatilis]